MSSPPTTRQWLIIILVNVVVSGVTAFFVFRALTSQLNPGTASTPAQAAVSDSPTASVTVTASLDATPSVTAPDADATATVPPEAGATPTEPSSAPAASTPATEATPTPAPAKVKISAVLFPGQLSREVAVLVNQGDQVNLKSWTLSSGSSTAYTFPDVILFKDNFINLHTMSGADVPTDLFWGRSEPAWKSGDTLTLARGDEAVATFTVR